VFVRTPISPWHQHSILPQRCALNLSLPDSFSIFDVAAPGLGRRPATAWDFEHLKRERQSIADQFDFVATLDAAAWRRPLTIDLHVPAAHGRC
jgi:hypothetical protein